MTDRVRLVVPMDGRVAVIKRWRPDTGHYAVLPGGGVEPGETMDDAARREAMEELGVAIEVVRRLAAEVIDDEEHTILLCRAIGGTFGTGTGEEYDGSRPEHRGTYEPALVAVDELAAIGLLPAWAVDAVPGWLS